MPINAHPDYLAAEGAYLSAQTMEDKIEKLRKMISLAPKHKGSENLLAQLKTRLKKLIQQQEKARKSGKGKKAGIKKEEMQAVIVGLTNTGKSSLLSALTNAKPAISQFPFTTKKPAIGMMPFSGIQIQLIEIPALESEYYDKGLANSADVLLILVNDMAHLTRIMPRLEKSGSNKIIVYNIKNTEENLRKIESTLKSKKYDFVILNTKTKEGLEGLKEKLFQSFGKIRIFTKEPGKEKSNKPMILNPDASVKDIAEKIIKNLSYLRETRIWGPSSKFSGQTVGLEHKLKDKDIVELQTI